MIGRGLVNEGRQLKGETEMKEGRGSAGRRRTRPRRAHACQPLSDPRDTVAAPPAHHCVRHRHVASAIDAVALLVHCVLALRLLRRPSPNFLARHLEVPARLISFLLPASRGLPTFLFELTPQKRAPQYLSPCVTHVELELDASPLAPRSGPHVLLDTLLFIVAFDLLSYGTFPFLSFVLDRPPLLFAPLSSS